MTIINSEKHAYFEINKGTLVSRNMSFRFSSPYKGCIILLCEKTFEFCIFFLLFTVYLKIYTNMAWGSSLVTEHLISAYNRMYILL